MNFNAYVERQKRIIRARSGGANYVERTEEYYIAKTEKLYAELCAMKGLNVKERHLADKGCKVGA